MKLSKARYENCVKKLAELYEQEWGWEIDNIVKDETFEQTLEKLIEQADIIKGDVEEYSYGDVWQGIMFTVQYVEHLKDLSVGYEKLTPVVESLLKLAKHPRKANVEGLEASIYAINGQNPPQKKIIKKIPVEKLKPHIIDLMTGHAAQIGQEYNISVRDLLDENNWKHNKDYSNMFGHIRRFFFRSGDRVWADVKINRDGVEIELLKPYPIDDEDLSTGYVFRQFAQKSIADIT